MADKNDPVSYAKYVRNLPSTERLLRQFLKVESSMNKRAYNRGYAFNFEMTQEQRDEVNKLMADGMTFDEAFDKYLESERKECCEHGTFLSADEARAAIAKAEGSET